MKKITCEICGSNDLIKKDNFFECQLCGTKYSTEEVKKIVLEGSIDISGSTVKIDNSGNIENYLSIAQNAYKANNMSECEKYCNMILEIDSKIYEALLLKGKLECRYARIEGAKSYFFHALDNVPDDKRDEVKEEILTEIFYIFEYLMNNVCEEAQEHVNSKHLCMKVVDYINENAKELKENFMELFFKCGVEEKNIDGSLAVFVINYVNKQFKEECEQYTSHYVFYKSRMFRSSDDDITLKIQWENFISAGDTCIYVNEEIIKSVGDETNGDAIRAICNCYEALISVQEILLNTHYSYTDMYTHISVESGFNDEEKLVRKNKIMEWHRKWNEIDPTHIIPTEEELL